jgi:hypothetical protein
MYDEDVTPGQHDKGTSFVATGEILVFQVETS